ncbi:hypothetical protein [Bythopirellula polymerisocia]|uniref:Uncharacterized protein n=1 Tax=Bythopirellula polymerisocia TaxID=2528003 RepID=A0A5C6CXJ0_9BACT|nr:hypothetical protein [Bythopirellula polymerisocia]TWU29663.1 hypothetical protein Pla144_04420 [Bythopirellula polymerisocia]
MDEHQEPAIQMDTSTPLVGKKNHHIKIWTFCAMLGLALVGLGLTMSMDRGCGKYWIFLLVFYGGVSVFWAWQHARKNHEPVWRMIRAQVFHWSSVFVAFAVLAFFEKTELINSVAASNVALLILALACFLAGVHFEWTFLLLGVVLTIMALSIGYLEKYLIWLIMLPVIITAGWVFVLLRKRHASADG